MNKLGQLRECFTRSKRYEAHDWLDIRLYSSAVDIKSLQLSGTCDLFNDINLIY